MSSTIPETTLSVGDQLHGFRILRVTPLPDLRAVAIQAEHEKSGARLLHLLAADPENLQAIAFRTPPPDSTGLPHILEHTVLCGSRRYPVKDPFVELLKTSLATFLNAMTYPDRTVYPCASMNRTDFFNAAGVYCDAVFHPRLTEMHFKQEGHHLEWTDPAKPAADGLKLKGIVFNEMKGVYSSLDGIMWRAMERLFPDNAYGLDSGGDPDCIPNLTYEQFRNFHARYYHPSNAFIFVYGDIPTADHLKFLDETCLGGFTRQAVDTAIAPQPLWDRPRRDTLPYPADAGDTPDHKSAFLLAWLTNPVTEAIETLGMAMLSEYLLGHAGSPLRKAIEESGLGEGLTMEGYSPERRDTAFSIGLKGANVAHAGRFRDLVLRVCGEVADRGLDAAQLEACFHQADLGARAIPSQYPLHLMGRVYDSWIYDNDPLTLLRAREHLAELRRRHAADPSYLPGLLRRWIVQNPHRLELTFVPDPDLNRRREAAWAERLGGVARKLSAEDRARIAREQAEIERMQSEPNTPAALATLPRLARRDVPPEPMPLDTRIDEAAGRPFLRTDLFSNGLTHLQFAFDLTGLPDDLFDLLPLFSDVFSKMGAGGQDYAAFASREAACCSGVGCGFSVGGRYDDPMAVQPVLTIGGTALDEKVPEFLKVVQDRLCTLDLADLARLKEVVLQGRTERRASVAWSGNAFAVSYALRNWSRNAALAERLSGVSMVRAFEGWAAEAEQNPATLAERLGRIRTYLQARDLISTSVVGAEAPVTAVRAWLTDLTAGWRRETAGRAAWCAPAAAFVPRPRTREAVIVPTDVAFAGLAFPAVGADHPLAGALTVLSTHLSYDYLWNEIRVKGGAYGAGASFNPAMGSFAFSSYRDPAMIRTFEAFARAPEYVARTMDRSAAAVEQMVIGSLKSQDRPIRPSAAVSVALQRYLSGWTDEARRTFRRRLLGVTGEELARAAAEILQPGMAQATRAVVGGRPLIEKEAKQPGVEPFKIEEL